jgi:hypothetical protein
MQRLEQLTFDVCDITHRDILPVLNEPVHPFLESGESLDISRFQYEGSVEGHETDHGSYRELLGMTETPLDGIVVETIFVVPKGQRLILASVGHGVGDEQEVLEELSSQRCSVSR